MNLGQVFSSQQAWNKLCAVNMKPSTAYSVLKYARKVSAEFEIVENQRVKLIREITKTADGESAKIEVGTPEFAEYAAKFGEIVSTDSDLDKCDLPFPDLLSAVEDKDESLSPADLALLEPFFES